MISKPSNFVFDNIYKITVYTIDEKMWDKQTAKLQEERNKQGKMLETMVTVSGLCCYPF